MKRCSLESVDSTERRVDTELTASRAVLNDFGSEYCTLRWEIRSIANTWGKFKIEIIRDKAIRKVKKKGPFNFHHPSSLMAVGFFSLQVKKVFNDSAIKGGGAGQDVLSRKKELF